MTADITLAPLSLLIVQATPFCNIDCSYCYLPERTNRGRLTPETLRRICTRILEHGQISPRFRVSWHVGEPMAIGVKRFGELCEVLRTSFSAYPEFSISVQTNGMLIDDDWLEAFAAFDVRVGLSIDGPQRFHDRFRIDRTGKGTFEAALRGLRRLKAAGRPFSVICVLHDASLKAPDEVFDFFEAEGVDTVCFNIEETLGDRVSASYGDADLPGLARSFFKRYFTRALAHGNRQWVRELNTILRSCANTSAMNSAQDQVGAAGAILSVDHQGNVSTFSPELLTWGGGGKGYAFANLQDGTVAQILSNPQFRRMAEEIAAGYRACEASCAYFRFCGGGVPAAKLAELGRFDGTETMHCKVSVQAPVDAFLEILPTLDLASVGTAVVASGEVHPGELEIT